MAGYCSVTYQLLTDGRFDSRIRFERKRPIRRSLWCIHNTFPGLASLTPNWTERKKKKRKASRPQRARPQ